jgi:hypothetical protein
MRLGMMIVVRKAGTKSAFLRTGVYLEGRDGAEYASRYITAGSVFQLRLCSRVVIRKKELEG